MSYVPEAEDEIEDGFVHRVYLTILHGMEELVKSKIVWIVKEVNERHDLSTDSLKKSVRYQQHLDNKHHAELEMKNLRREDKKLRKDCQWTNYCTTNSYTK